MGIVTSTEALSSSTENAHIMLEMAKKRQIMLESEDYAFPFGLCFSIQIMLKIMLAYCINAYQLEKSAKWSIRAKT